MGLTAMHGSAAAETLGTRDLEASGDPGQMWIDLWRHESVSDDNWEIARDGAEAFATWMTEYMDYPTSVWEWGPISDSLPNSATPDAWEDWIDEHCSYTDYDSTYTMPVIADDDFKLGRNIGGFLNDDNEWPGSAGYVNASHAFDPWTPSNDNHLYNIVSHEILHSFGVDHDYGDHSVNDDTSPYKPTAMATGYVYGGYGANDPPDSGSGCNYSWDQHWNIFNITPEPCVTDCTLLQIWRYLDETSLPPYKKYHYFTDAGGPAPPESALTPEERTAIVERADGQRPRGLEGPRPAPTGTSERERPGVSDRRRL